MSSWRKLCLSHFQKCVVEIDCFKVFCERPKPLKAQADHEILTSQHSEILDWNCSTRCDNIHFQRMGWLSLRQTSYIVLWYSGQTSSRRSSIGRQWFQWTRPGAEVKLPPFTKEKKQLSKVDVDCTRQLSCVRIHVERVIGVLRQKYTFLESTRHMNMIMSRV